MWSKLIDKVRLNVKKSEEEISISLWMNIIVNINRHCYFMLKMINTVENEYTYLISFKLRLSRILEGHKEVYPLALSYLWSEFKIILHSLYHQQQDMKWVCFYIHVYELWMYIYYEITGKKILQWIQLANRKLFSSNSKIK